MDRPVALVATLLVGLLVAAQPAVNGSLRGDVGDLGAAFVSLAGSLLIVTVLLLTVGDVGQLRDGLGQVRPVHALGGLAGASVVFVSLVAVRTLGAGGVAAALVTTQLTGAVVLDRLGVLDLPGTPITPSRVLGIGLLIAGTVLVTSTG